MEIKDEKTGKNMIEAFYENQEKYSFEFQMMAYISRLQKLQDTMKTAQEEKYDLIICERSLETDKNVFCKMLYDEEKLILMDIKFTTNGLNISNCLMSVVNMFICKQTTTFVTKASESVSVMEKVKFQFHI